MLRTGRTAAVRSGSGSGSSTSATNASMRRAAAPTVAPRVVAARSAGHDSKVHRESLEAASRASARATNHGRRLPEQVADAYSYYAFARARGQAWKARHYFGGALLALTLGFGSVVVVKQAFAGEKKALKPSERRDVVIVGSGFAALAAARTIDTGRYNVKVISPRNHFLFTPVLGSVAFGTLDASSAVEPVRNFLHRNGQEEVQFLEGSVTKIDPQKKSVSVQARGGTTFEQPYDKLILATGSKNNTHGIADLSKYANFLRDLEDASRLRSLMLDRLEEAVLPVTSAQRKRELCTFVVVGGGPSSVNIASQLHDLLHADMKKLFPQLEEIIEVKFIDIGGATKNTYDKKVASWFQADFENCEHIKVEKSKVLNVTDKEITLEHGVKIPYGVLVWATQPSTTPLIESIRKFAPEAQRNKHALVTNAYLQVEGVGDGDIYAVGECATLAQPHIISKLKQLFKELDSNGDGVIDEEEFQAGIKANVYKSPQLQEFASSTHELFVAHDKDNDGVLSEKEFEQLLKAVDSSLTGMPTSAQTAQQQGQYVAESLNNVLTEKQIRKLFEELDADKSGSLDVDEVAAGTARLGLPSTKKAVREFMDALDKDNSGSIDEDEFVEFVLKSQASPTSAGDWKRLSHHKILPFRYQHLGGYEYVGYDQSVTERGSEGRNILDGYGAWWLWRSVFLSTLLSDQNRAKLAFGWFHNKVFGRELTRS